MSHDILAVNLTIKMEHISGQILIFHQHKGISLTKPPFGVEVVCGRYNLTRYVKYGRMGFSPPKKLKFQHDPKGQASTFQFPPKTSPPASFQQDSNPKIPNQGTKTGIDTINDLKVGRVELSPPPLSLWFFQDEVSSLVIFLGESTLQEIQLTSWGWQFIPPFTRGLGYIPGGAGFLNHQQYHSTLIWIFLRVDVGKTKKNLPNGGENGESHGIEFVKKHQLNKQKMKNASWGFQDTPHHQDFYTNLLKWWTDSIRHPGCGEHIKTYKTIF